MKPGSGQKKFGWKQGVAIAITAAALYLVFQRIDAAELGRLLANMRVRWFLAAIVVFGLLLLCGAYRWHLMLRLTRANAHLGASVRLYYIGHAFNVAFFGPAVGDMLKSVVMNRWFRKPLPLIIASAPLDRMLGLIGLAGFCIFGLLLAILKDVDAMGDESRSAIPLPFLIGAALCGIAGLAVVLFWRPKSDGPIARTFRAFSEGFTQLFKRPSIAVPGLAMGFLVQAGSAIVYMFCLVAVVTVPCPWLSMIWVFPVIGAMTAVPSVAGLGVREGASLALLALYGVPEADAVAASLLSLPVNLFWVLVGGGIFFRENALMRRLADQNQTPSGPEASKPLALSVVIPTLNEEAELPEMLRRLRLVPEVTEIIVSDGGSEDGTVDLARAEGCFVVTSEPGRGKQLRHGCAAAKGDVVLMAHADTWVPPEAGMAIQDCLSDPSVVGGGFWKTFRDTNPMLLGSRFKCGLRLVLFKRILADQGIFMRKSALDKMGGIPDVPLMEEFEICNRLRDLGRLALADAVVRTSSRRFRKLGVLRVYWRMAWVTLSYYRGTPPEKLKEIYESDA